MADRQTMPRTMTGVVTSNKGEKTIVVKVERQVKHPMYEKYIRRSTKLHAHDEKNAANIGDLVTIQECRPISKLKKWALLEVKERAA